VGGESGLYHHVLYVRASAPLAEVLMEAVVVVVLTTVVCHFVATGGQNTKLMTATRSM
jgi:hypothetical protein